MDTTLKNKNRLDDHLADEIVSAICQSTHLYLFELIHKKERKFNNRYHKLLTIIQSRLSGTDLMVDKMRYKFTNENSDIIFVDLMSVDHIKNNPYYARAEDIRKLSLESTERIRIKYLTLDRDDISFISANTLIVTIHDELGSVITEIFPRITNTDSGKEVEGFIWLIDACKELIRKYQNSNDNNDNIYQVPLSAKRKLFDDLCILRKRIVESPSEVQSIIDEAYKDNFGGDDRRR